MDKYNIEIIETLSRVVEQKANSYEEAEELVSNKYDKSEIILDYEDKEDVMFKPYPSQEIKSNFKVNITYNKDKKLLKMIKT